MSIENFEQSSYGGDPTLLFLYQMGTTRWGYIGQDVEPYFFNGVDFMPDTNAGIGAMTQSGMEVGTDIEITLSSIAEVAQLFIPYLPPEPIHVTVYRAMPDAAPGEYEVELRAEVVSSLFDEDTGVCTFTARLLSKDLAREIPWCIYSGMCNYAVYGNGCGVQRELFETATTISAGAGTDTLGSPAFATAGAGNAAPEQWFRGGFIIHLASREIRFIIKHDTNSPDIKIQTPFRYLKNGDEVKVYPGCNRLRSHCGPRFNNRRRMLGFPWLPSKNPYTQSVFGNSTDNTRVGDRVKAIMSKLRD